MPCKLTKRVVEGVTPAPGRVVQVRDSLLPGFIVRVTPNGTRTYALQYRDPGGRTRRVTIGRHGVLTAEQARERARVLLGEVAAGQSPAESRRRKREEARRAETVATFAARYLRQHAERHKKPASVYNDRRIIERFVIPRLGRMRVEEVTRRDITKLHQILADTPFQANRVLALLSKLFAVASAWGVRPDGANPCVGVQRYRERGRERFLSSEELARLAEVLRAVEHENVELPAVAAAIKLLILTGCRRGEVLAARWEYINWEGRRLDLPDSKTGPRSVPLSAPAMMVLEELRQRSEGVPSPWVLPGRDPGKPLVGLPHAWQRIRKRAGLEDVRLHDLRHTHASIGAGAGLSLPVIGRLLGHHQPSTTARYSHLSDDPLRQASDMIGSRIAAAMSGGGGAEVIELAGRKKRAKS